MADPLSSEIRLTTKRPLPDNLGEALRQHFRQPSGNPQILAARTGFKDLTTTIARTVYAVDQDESITLYVPQDAHTLLILMERTTAVSDITPNNEASRIQNRAQQCIDSMGLWLKKAKRRNKISNVGVDISWGAFVLFRAERKPFWNRFRDKGKANVYARGSVPIAAAIAGLLIGVRAEDVFKTFLSALIAVVIAVVIEAYLEDAFKYEKFL